MSRYTMTVARISAGVVEHYADPEAPDVVHGLSESLGMLVLDHPEVDRLEITVAVFP